MRSVAGVFLSLTLHAGLVAWGYLYFPTAFSNLAQSVIVPVELVTVADTTNIAAARPDPIEEEPEVEEEAPDPEPEIQPEPDTTPEPIAPEPEPEPIAPEPEPEAAEDVAPEPEPEVETDPVEEEPEPVRREPEPEPEPQGLDLDRLSGLVDRAREQTVNNTDNEGQFRQAIGNGEDMTATVQTLFQSQIARCVRANADAPADMDLAVQVEVRLKRDGSLEGEPRLINQGRIMNSSNPYLRVAGQRALRAVINCAPYNLPADRYQQWRLLEVNVDTQGI